MNHVRPGKMAKRSRRETADERAAEREKRGDKGQLDRLNKLSYTAKRERALLEKRIK